MNSDDIEKLLNKKVRGIGYDRTQNGYTLVIMTTTGKTFYFTSDTPIDCELEQEQ